MRSSNSQLLGRLRGTAFVAAVAALLLLASSAHGQAPETDPVPAPAPAPQKTPAPSPPDASAPTDPGAADEQVTPPVLLQDVKPVYPQAAQEASIAAEVLLAIDLDAEGLVERATILQSAQVPDQGFDEAALEAAKKLVFEPAKLGGQAIPVTIQYRFRFVPDVKPQPEVVPGPEPEPVLPVGELAGQLTERGTRLPIVGAKITLFRGEGDSAEGFEVDTDEDGNFVFRGLGVGTWRLLADPDGYFPVRVEEKIFEGERTKVSYRIERQSYNAYDVIVETEKVRREVSQVSISAKQAERIPGTFGDVLAVVQNFPGVARSQGGQVIVRGSAPEDTRVFVQGVDVPIIYHFGGLRSVLPVGMVERIDFYPGNFGVEFGRATGGIIDVDLKDLAPKKVGGYADVSILDTSLYLEAPINKKTAVALAGRRSYIDYILGPLLPDNGTTFVLPRYYDAQALATYRPKAAHRLQTFFFYSNDRFEVLFDEPAGDRPDSIAITDIGYKVDFARAIASYDYIPSETFSNKLKLSVGRDRIDFNVGEDFFVKINNLQLQLRDTANYTVNDKLNLRGGVDYLVNRVNYRIRIPDFRNNNNDDQDGPPAVDEEEFLFTESTGTFHSPALFSQAEVTPVPDLLLIGGVRLDYFSRTKNVALAPRLSGRYQFNDQWALKGGIGLFVQEADYPESDPELGNPDLDLEKAMHYSIGGEYRPRKHIKLDVTAFYKTLHDLVINSDGVREVNGESVPLRVDNDGSGRVVGLEISARHELAKGLFGWVAYTLSRAERKELTGGYELFDFDQTHILTVIGSYQLPRNWEISSRFRLVSGNLYTPITGAVFDADADRYQAIRGPNNSARVGAFNQVDFRIDKKWIYDTWMLNAYLDIQNMFNRANPEGLNYNFDYTETTTTQGLPIVPVLGLRGEF